MKIAYAVLCSLILAVGAAGQGHPKSQKQEQEQGQRQQQQQKQTANAEVNSSIASNMAAGAAATNTSVQDTRIPRQAPPAVAPDSFPSAPCRVAFGAGASAPIGGLSVGGSKLDNECDKRETARAFANLGLRDAAVRILCTTKAAKKALGADCIQDSRRWIETHPNFPY